MVAHTKMSWIQSKFPVKKKKKVPFPSQAERGRLVDQ
jgi:hypothetical protein